MMKFTETAPSAMKRLQSSPKRSMVLSEEPSEGEQANLDPSVIRAVDDTVVANISGVWFHRPE